MNDIKEIILFLSEDELRRLPSSGLKFLKDICFETFPNNPLDSQL